MFTATNEAARFSPTNHRRNGVVTKRRAAAVAGVAALSLAVLGAGPAMAQATAGSATGSAAIPPSKNPHVQTYPFSCFFGLFQVNVSIFATAPGSVQAGQPVSLQAVRSQVQIPTGLVDTLLSVFPTLTSLSGQFTQLDFQATNATPGTLDSATTPLPFTVPLVAGQPATITIPATDTSTVGPWTAGPNGTISFTPGASVMTLTPLGSLPISCAPPSGPTPLATTVIR